MNIRSISELENFIANDFSWRRKEITNLRNMALNARMITKDTLIRSTISLLYAHWEGFIKQVSIAKILFLASKGFKYNQLVPSFHAFAIINEFQGQIPTKKFDAIVKIINGSIDLSAAIPHDTIKYIDTKSNLNSEVLREIALKINIDYSKFILKEHFIDSEFVALRNKIVHGERVVITELEFEELYKNIIELIDIFKNQVLNSIYTETFLLKNYLIEIP